MSKDEDDRSDDAPGLNVRFLWVLLGVMVSMVAMPLLPERGRYVYGVLLMLWIAYELWLLVFRGIRSR